MPVYPVVGDVIESRVCCYTPTQISLNVLHWRVGIVAGDGANLSEIANLLDAAWVSAFKALMSADAKYRGTGCRVLGPVSPKSIEYAYVGNDGVGTIVADLLPGQVTYVIQKRSTLAGKANMGRIYPGFPPVTAADADGLMAGAYAATVAALATLLNTMRPTLAFVGATGTTTVVPVIKHSGGTTTTVIDTYHPTAIFANQRRRSQSGKQNVLPF